MKHPSLRDSLEASRKRNGSSLILALDYDGPPDTRLERASSLVRRVGSSVAGIKINFHLLLPFGTRGVTGLVEECHSADLPVISDFKLNDIGSTNSVVIEALLSAGFDAIIANPFVGYKDAMDLVLASGIGVILLVYMSHAGAREGFGLRDARGQRLYVGFARKTRAWGADGAIVSGRSPTIIRRVRSIIRPDQLILSPGIGFQGGDARRAMSAGSDYIIVGRSVTMAASPSGAVTALNALVGSGEGRRSNL